VPWLADLGYGARRCQLGKGIRLHLALKAFHPSKPPFPLLHVDTTWKFREMIEFRGTTTQRLGLDLIVHVNSDALAMSINCGRMRTN
jgi:3'-phosphoadenosine 5'-phosphosulfate sulfotransferase (PAPS reductase)/FAD synthetase